MKSTIRKRAALFLALALYLTGLVVPALAEVEKLVIAVTILPQQALAGAVVGDLADVITMVPAGTNPGNYEPTLMEMEAFSKAKVYFTIGVPTEKANILPDAKDMDVVDLPVIVAERYPDCQFPSGSRDPHIWLSPKRAIVMVNTMAEKLGEVDLNNAATYQANAKVCIAQLNDLDQYIATAFHGKRKKEFIAYHPAYGYIADDYGLTMYALEEDGKEATPQKLAEMVDLAKADGIKTIFSQAEIDSKQPDAFAEDVGGTKVMLAPLSEDYISNLKTMADAIANSMT